MEAPGEADGRKKERRGGGGSKVGGFSMKEVETAGIGGGRGCGEARGSLPGEGAGERTTPRAFVRYNLGVAGPLPIFETLSNATVLGFQIKHSFYCRFLLCFSLGVLPEQLWREQIFYWKYNKRSTNAAEASRRALATVERGA